MDNGKLIYVSNGKPLIRNFANVLIHAPDGRTWQPEYVPKQVVLVAGDIPRGQRTLEVFLGKAKRSAIKPSRMIGGWRSHAIAFVSGSYFMLSVFWYLS